MKQIVNNELMQDGMRRLKVIGDVEISFAQYQAMVPIEARARVKIMPGRDDLLNIFSLVLTWPVCEPYEIACFGPRKFRRLMLVNFIYEKRVSDCIELGRVNYFSGTRHMPGYAFVQELPKGAENGMDVHGCILFEAEWMPAHCVAIGGRNG